MSFHVPASFQTMYKNNVEMVLDQQQSKLLGAVEVTDDRSAEKIKVKDLVGNTKPNEATERHGDTKWNNTPHDGVWLPKKPELYYADIVDNADQLQTGIDLQGTYTTSGAGTIQRAHDQRILEGFFADVISGKEGTVVTPLPASQVVAVDTGAGAATGMNVAKLRAANKKLAQSHADLTEQRFMVLTAEQSDDLLSEIPATSADFKQAFGGEVQDGFLTRLLGWNFIHVELANSMLGPVAELTLDGNGYRKNPFWVKSGVRANFWQRTRPHIGVLPMKEFNTGVFVGTTLAATRTQAGKSGYILNVEP